MKFPSGPVFTDWRTARAWSTTATVAPGITPPLESFTVPVMEPLFCASAQIDRAASTISAASILRTFRTMYITPFASRLLPKDLGGVQGSDHAISDPVPVPDGVEKLMMALGAAQQIDPVIQARADEEERKKRHHQGLQAAGQIAVLGQPPKRPVKLEIVLVETLEIAGFSGRLHSVHQALQPPRRLRSDRRRRHQRNRPVQRVGAAGNRLPAGRKVRFLRRNQRRHDARHSRRPPLSGEREFRLVRESLRERNRLLRNAPHYVKPLPTTIPIFSWTSGMIPAIRNLLGWPAKPGNRGALLIKTG
jgi:hypothetical protein